MEQHKIALLILCTSNKRDNWKSIKDSYFYNLTLKTFLINRSLEHKYIFYIGIDKDDRIFDKKEEQDEIIRFKKVFENIDFKFVIMQDIKKGHVTKMWNVLFQQAYNEKCDYFFQCGDDINFKSKNWINDAINILKKHNNIGLTGPINNNFRILTQAFVSRKHMEIFGWFFPEQIINWCCDDWYNGVYKPNYFFPLINHFCSNDGGSPRYDINHDPNYTQNHQITMQKTAFLRHCTDLLIKEHKTLLMNFLKRKY